MKPIWRHDEEGWVLGPVHGSRFTGNDGFEYLALRPGPRNSYTEGLVVRLGDGYLTHWSKVLTVPRPGGPAEDLT